MYRRNPENQPIQQAAVFNQGGDGSIDNGTAILSTALTPKNPPSMFRIMVSLQNSKKFWVTVKQDTTTKDMIFNNDSALGGNCLYVFDMLVTSDDDEINFEQAGDNQVVNVLVVQEINVGSQ